MFSSRLFNYVLAAVGVTIFLVLLYQAGLTYLDRRLEEGASVAAGRSVTIDDLAIGVSPPRLKLFGTVVRESGTNGSTVARIPELTVQPNLPSLLSDTVVLEKIYIRDSDVRLAYPAPATAAAGTVPRRSEPPPSDFRFPLRVRTIQVRNASVGVFRSDTDSSPVLDLAPVDVRAGPVTTKSLRDGVPVSGNVGFGAKGGRLHFDVKSVLLGQVRVSGMLGARDVPLAILNEITGPGFRFDQGHVSGEVPFNVSSDTIGLKRTTLRVESARAKLGYAPEITPGTAPLSVRKSVQDTPVTTSADTSRAVSLNLGEIRFEVLDSSIDLLSLPSIPPVLVDRATVLAGPDTNSGRILPVRGQLILNQPDAVFEMRGSVPTTGRPVGVKDLIAYFRVNNVADLDPYVESVTPIKLKGGRLTGGLKGLATSRKLDLEVELDFDNLESGSITDSKSSVLGIPVSLFVKYLNQNDGNLNVHFSVSGTPARPVVDTTGIRTRILVNLGVDAAVIGTLGVPVYLGNELIQRTSGINLLGTARDTVQSLFGAGSSSPEPVFELEADTPRQPGRPESQ